jgi:hypothetical protein
MMNYCWNKFCARSLCDLAVMALTKHGLIVQKNEIDVLYCFSYLVFLAFPCC